MTIKLYGISGSRALRSLWAAEETGVAYEQVTTNFGKDAKTDDYLAINPNGRIPALVDGDLLLCESMAINLYLAKNYGGDLYPQDAASEATTWQWSVWGISEIEPLQMQIVVQKLFTPEEKRDAGVIARAEKGLQRPLAVLDDQLADQPYLLGQNFSIADLNVAGVMQLFQMIKLDVSSWTNVQAWLDRCYGRESLARAQAKA